MTSDLTFQASFKFRSLLFEEQGEFSWKITARGIEEALSSARWTMFEWTLPDPKEPESGPPMRTWGLKVEELQQ